MISQFKFRKAKQYIKSYARPLDRALYDFEFNNGTPQAVIDALKTYQNKDGGFGQALEPDYRSPKSSVLATTVAMQYLSEINLAKPIKMIEKAIYFFISEIKKFPKDSPLKYYWHPVLQESDTSLQAPWWSSGNPKPPSIEEWPNPGVEVIGYLLQYSQFVSPSLLDELVKSLKIYLELVPILTKSIYYNFLCFKRLLPHIPKILEKDLFDMLDESFSDIELLNLNKLKEIKIQRLVTENTSFLFQKFPKRIASLLKDEVERLGSDGGSHPNWKWGDTNLWRPIEREWTGKLTCELLVSLKYCNLLEYE